MKNRLMLSAVFSVAMLALASFGGTTAALAGQGKQFGYANQAYSMMDELEKNFMVQRALKEEQIRNGETSAKIYVNNSFVSQTLIGSMTNVNVCNGDDVTCSDITVTGKSKNNGDITGSQDVF